MHEQSIHTRPFPPDSRGEFPNAFALSQAPVFPHNSLIVKDFLSFRVLVGLGEKWSYSKRLGYKKVTFFCRTMVLVVIERALGPPRKGPDSEIDGQPWVMMAGARVEALCPTFAAPL
jgi:hypothetical protein